MALKIHESILLSVKKLVNADGDNYFDTDLMIHINTVFNILAQMGVGPCGGFSIDDEKSTWDEFTDDDELYNMVKSYMVLRVKLLFDISTASSYLIQTWKEEADELEWRLRAQAELDDIDEE